ncbi:thermonuclease family protein [Alkalihalobacterium chitinilyticum]|uniref:Thermonuclease family protein n=1 Tax=Alkalihalobacterium chitinilyticum TaxID=2980103 RepID=A0ABT5VL96_9BACI|nr:thermonuclease family protein [Alkalihalobacterium chitinilyticum]MDE5416040.1 thermonuclease family protein [Alkalihalobacterium chitinilyticum]
MKRTVLLLFTILFLLGCSEIPEAEPVEKSAEEVQEQVQEDAPTEDEQAEDQSEETIDNTTELSEETTADTEEGKQGFIPAHVVRVVDGDTVIVKLSNGQEERVRLLLVDTPESVHPNKPVQPFGPESSQLAKDMMPVGEKVYLEMDVGERDRYGRLLAYVWVGDKMFNELLLEKGLARVAYVFAPNTRHVDRFYEIQKKAQQQAIGIWSIENYATDRGFDESVVEEKKETAPTATPAPKAGCDNPTIKGNHSSSGEFIYHVPGGQFYDRTNPEEMFCTEEEAVAAGYRKSKR